MDWKWNGGGAGQFQEKTGRGIFRYALGEGASGRFGHVEVLVRTVPMPGHYSIQWDVSGQALEHDAHDRIVAAARNYMTKYADAYKENGVHLAIVQASSDEIRRNDYERATEVAVRFALEDAGLPVPRIFAP